MEVNRSTVTVLTTLIAPISWGTTYVTVTELLPPDRPLFVALMRVVPAGALLAVVGLVTSGWRPVGREWRPLAVLAIVNFGFFFPLLIVGVYRLPGGVAASFGGMQPLLVAVVGRLIDGRRLRAIDVGVGVAAVVGVAMVVVRPGADVDLVGVVAAAGANVSFAIGVVLTKRWPPTSRLAATGWQLLLGGVFILPVALLVEGPPPRLGPSDVVGLTHLSLVATGVAFVLWFRGVERLPAAAPPLLGLAAPLTGAALGWLLLAEDLTLVQILGFAVTGGAIAYGAVVVPTRTRPGTLVATTPRHPPRRASATVPSVACGVPSSS